MIDQNAKVYIAGHSGMVGSALFRKFTQLGFKNIITRTSKELDLTDQLETEKFISETKPDVVILAAAKVGGIQANINAPTEFLLDNLNIQNNVIWSSFKNEVKHFVFLGSSCIYPKECPQPMKEEYLLTGKLEPTNEGYAIAKIAGLKLCEYLKRQYGFKSISVMPCNLYGINDCFDPENSHVLGALVKKMVDAKNKNLPKVEIWGDGQARREFMFVDDCAEAVVHCMHHYTGSDFINIGVGEDVSIKELALLIQHKVGYTGDLFFNTSKPNGMLRKCMDVSKLKSLGYEHKISLERGIEYTIEEYINKK